MLKYPLQKEGGKSYLTAIYLSIKTTENSESNHLYLELLGNVPCGKFFFLQSKISQVDLQTNFNSFSEMDSGACKEIKAGFCSSTAKINKGWHKANHCYDGKTFSKSWEGA